MILGSLMDWFTAENIRNLIEQYRSLGIVTGFLLPFLDAFFPFLPLFAFVIANVNAYGSLVGFLISWFGSVTGSYIVFLLIRKYGHLKLLSYVRKNKQVKKLTVWVETHGFSPVFIFFCFPFTPSAVVTIVAGLSKMNTALYILALMAGKLVMIFTMTFIGQNIYALIHNPIRSIIVGIIIFLLWYIGKRIEKRYLNHSIEMNHSDGE